MKLSRYTDYAFRLLLYVAANERRCTLAEVADYYDISLDHLRKVVHALGQYNYITTYKGKSGGFELSSQPEDICLADVFRDFEFAKEPLIACKKLNCVLTSNCRLKRIFKDCENAFIAELANYTLADLLEPKTVQLLHL